LEKLEDAKEICVDTDVLIDFLKRKDPGSQTYELWRKKASVGITSITAFELILGAKLSHVKEKRYEEVMSLIRQHEKIYPFDIASAEIASEIGAELRRQGNGIEIRDLFNAAICVRLDIPILTRNKNHYQRVTELGLVDV